MTLGSRLPVRHAGAVQAPVELECGLLVGGIAGADLAAQEHEPGIRVVLGHQAERIEERVEPLTGIAQAKVDDDQSVWIKAKTGSECIPVVIRRWGAQDVRANWHMVKPWPWRWTS